MPTTICMLVINSVSRDPRVRREAEMFGKAGYRVTVIGVRREGDAPREWLDGFLVVRIAHPKVLLGIRRERTEGHAQPVGLRGSLSRLVADLLNIGSVLWMNLAMAREAIRQEADVYHAHDLDTLPAGYLAKLWTGSRLVYDVHELFTELYPKGAKSGVWRSFFSALERLLLRRTDLKLTVCDSLGQWMVHRYGINGAVTIMNTPSRESVSPHPLSGRRERIVLYHGVFLPDRGLEQLIESAQYLEGGKIVLRGFGPMEGRLRYLVQEYGLRETVSFAPPVPVTNLVEAASAADIGVIPYLPACDNLRLCLPNKLFEYMMAGLAVVATDLQEVRKIIQGHDLGLILADPEDPRSIARALNTLLKDEAHLEDMKRRALQAARSLYNWECEGAKLLRAYDGMARKT